jgi:hypothetical protein
MGEPPCLAAFLFGGNVWPMLRPEQDPKPILSSGAFLPKQTQLPPVGNVSRAEVLANLQSKYHEK